ncbi:hypothetical protein ACC786_20835 [Rhizobium ruizarguesonis]|uniref:hypothetical protein n=1 Tax=Rhizobium ruizarguesonis TaxID=2081791 RepID=UPI001FE1F4B2|nr:hypothetical protein [Rhizobium ruizarguesonis]
MTDVNENPLPPTPNQNRPNLTVGITYESLYRDLPTVLHYSREILPNLAPAYWTLRAGAGLKPVTPLGLAMKAFTVNAEEDAAMYAVADVLTALTDKKWSYVDAVTAWVEQHKQIESIYGKERLSPVEQFLGLVSLNSRFKVSTPQALKALLDSAPVDLRIQLKEQGLLLTITPNDVKCFPGSTPVQISALESRAISDLRIGDIVLAFDPGVDVGRGQLAPRRVMRLFRNVTTEWVKLSWAEAGEQRELVSTPGHHFLDRFGNFLPIQEMIESGRATVILVSGAIAEVAVERISYSAETAHLFERAETHGVLAGNTALKPLIVEGWQTYNFEVEDLHTYIAGGVRVHNMSDQIAHDGRGVDDWGDLAVAYNVPGYGTRALNGTALDYYYNALGGANGFAGTALGWGLATAATANFSGASGFLMQAIFGVAYAEKAGKYDNPATTRYLGYSAVQYAQTVEAAHGKISQQGFYESLGPARYGEKIGSPEHVADRAFAAGYSFLEAYASRAKVSIYSDAAYRALDKHRAENEARLSGSSGSSSSSSSSKSSKGSYSSSKGSDYGPSPSGNWSSSTRPVLLDLSGNGLSIETLSTSSKFLDLDGDGYQHRTAWAGTGTGVLVIDADADGKISRSKEFAFTEWDSSATSDLEALKHVFDTNANGKLDSGDAQWSKFRVEVNGQLVTLDSLGITSIDLTPKGSGQTYEDGSAITGTTTFTRADGTTGTVGDAKLANDDAAYIVKTSSTTKADSSVEKTILAYNTDGSLAFRNVVTTSADGKSVQTQFDDDGNGTFDRSQTNVLTVDASGVQTKTVSNFNADGSLADRTTTVTSADHLTVTTTIDQDGDGITNQRQTYVQNADGSTATTTEQLSVNGTLLTKTMVASSANGLVKTTSLDRDGNGVYDDIVTETTTVAADGSRTKTVIDRSANNKVLSQVDTSTSADGRTITVSVDADGNGPRETKTVTTSTTAASGDVTLVTSTYNTNASSILRSKTTTVTTANGLKKTVTSDVNADNIIDFTDIDETVITADNRTQTVQHRTKAGITDTLLSQTITTTSTDGKKITIAEDVNGDTKNDRLTEILVGTDGKTTNTISNLNSDGSLVSKTVTVTSVDGLSKTTSTDVNGDGVYDLVVSDVITNETNGSRTETVTSKNANGATIATSVTNTTADSLTQSVKTDTNGDGVFEETTTDVIVLDGTGKRTETVTSKSADGTLNAQTITEVSANRQTTTVWTDADGDGKTDTRQVKVIAADGSTTTTETAYTPNDTVTGTTSSTVTVSGTGLTTTTSVDLNRDSVADRITTEQTVLNTDGSTTETISIKSSNATLLDKKTVVTSGNGKSITTSEDLNGDGVVDTKTTDVTTFDTYGLQFETVSNFQGTTLVNSAKVTTNLNGLAGSTDYDLDGDGTVNQTLSWKKTPLDPLGSVTITETVRATDTDATLISQKITTVSADKKTTTISSKIDSDTVVDRLETITIDDVGTQKDDVKQYKALDVLESQAVITTSDDGLSKTLSSDLDGNGIFEVVTTDVTVLNTDGSRTQTISKKGVSDALISRTTAKVNASGLTKTISWADASGNAVRSMSDVTVLNADGGTTETLSYFKANGTTLESQTVTTVAAHGLSSTVTIDVDGNATVDKKSVTTKQADGSTIQTFIDFGATNALKDSKTITTSADGLTQTIEYDSDGNATVDKKTTTTTVLNANGGRTTTTKDIVGSVTKSITVTDVSGDGLTTTTKWDTTGTGGGTTFNKSRTEVTVFNVDGSKTQTVSNLTGTTLTSRYLVETDAKGWSITTKSDPTGTGTYSQIATDVTILKKDDAGKTDGTKIRTVESKRAADDSLISRTTTTISANGLIITSSQERPGFTNQTVTNTTTVLADGAIRETVETKDNTGTLIGKEVTLTSADKLTVTIDRDGNGDGIVDQRQQTVTANSGIQTTVTTNFEANGTTVKNNSSMVVSADGRVTTTTWDLDGNGTVDRKRVINLTSNADGSSTTVISDSDLPANTLTAKTTIQTSADGRVKTTSKDINVDNTVDELQTVTIDSTGAVVTNTATARNTATLTSGVVYWKQAIAAKIETTTLADGRTEVVKYDYDGNGVNETVMQSTLQVDGSVITTVTETGTTPAKGTIATSADGLVTTLSKDTDNNGSIDHIETAVTHADGSITLSKKDANAVKQTVVEEVRSTGTLAYRKTTDLSGTAVNWSYSEETYDGWGRRVSANVVYDDGTRLAYRYDATNTNSWWQLQYSYTGTTLNWLREFWDNGTLTHRQYDYNPNNNYWQIANDEYADGTLIQQTKYFDNGNYDVIRNGVTYHYNASGDPIGPVLLDLDDDGHVDLRPIDLSNMAASPTFDWDSDGVRDTTAWTGPSDGFLAIDLAADGAAGPDGIIDQAKELAFSLWAEQDGVAGSISDLDGVRLVFDTNHDNVLNSDDERWNEFRVWRDANQNGLTDQGELLTMTDAGIKLINLMPTREGSQAFADGSIITGTSSYETLDGSKHLVADASLIYRPTNAA